MITKSACLAALLASALTAVSLQLAAAEPAKDLPRPQVGTRYVESGGPAYWRLGAEFDIEDRRQAEIRLSQLYIAVVDFRKRHPDGPLGIYIRINAPKTLHEDIRVALPVVLSAAYEHSAEAMKAKTRGEITVRDPAVQAATFVHRLDEPRGTRTAKTR